MAVEFPLATSCTMQHCTLTTNLQKCVCVYSPARHRKVDSVSGSYSTVFVGELIFSTQYVVFEYCSGTDLFNFLVTGPFEKLKR